MAQAAQKMNYQNLDKTILRDKRLMKFEKDQKPGTIKAYLGALHRLYAFLKCEWIQFPGAPNLSEILGSMLEQMKMWSKTYNKQVKERFTRNAWKIYHV